MGLRPGQQRGPYVGFGASVVTGGANVGAGTGNVFRNKTGNTLNFRTLEQGLGITITTVGDVVHIAAAAFSDIYWQNPIISFFDPTPGLPVGPAVGDRYVATATANGWTNKHIFEWNGTIWVDTAPLEGMALYDKNTDTIYQFDGANWVGIGAINALANVGAGTGLVWRDTIAGTANLKSLLAGTSIAITNNANDITIAATNLNALLQAGSAMQVYALTGGSTAISANHTFTFDNRYLQSFWASKQVFTSLDWDLVIGGGLRGLAANNATDSFKTGVRGEFDLLAFCVVNNANPVGIIASGNGQTAQLKIDNAGNITASYTGQADVVVATGAASMFLRIKFEERNTVSFYYRSGSGDPWILVVQYNNFAIVDLRDNITLSLLASPQIAGVYNFIRELTLNITPDCDPTVFSLTDAVTIAVDASRSENFAVTLGGNRTLGAPTNPRGDGQVIRIRVTQDGAGNRSLNYNAIYRFPSGRAPIPDFTAAAQMILTFMYNVAAVKWDFISVNYEPPFESLLTDAATISIVALTGPNFVVTLGGNRTLGAPTQVPGGGFRMNIRVKQDGTGGRTLAYNAIYRFPNGAPVLQTKASAVDILTFEYDAVDTKWDFISINSGTTTVGTLTDAATIAVDASSSYNSEFMVTLGGNRTLGAPTNPLGDGQILRIRCLQDGTGGRTLAFNAIYRFPNGTPVLQKTANALDILTFMYNMAAVKWDFIGLNSFTTTVGTLTDAATIAVDASSSYNSEFMVTLAGNRTLGAPTNPLGDGQIMRIRVKQDGTGGRTLAYNAIYRFPGGGTPVLQTAANAQDILTFMYHAGDTKWDFIGMNSVTSQYVTLTDAATIAVDASLGSKFKVTLGGNRTLGNPTNPAGAGQLMLIQVTQDGTGGRTLAYDTKYRFSTSLPSPTLSTGINKVDYLGFVYSKVADKWDFISFVQGFN